MFRGREAFLTKGLLKRSPDEPVSAIQTTDTAEGTRAANAPKCNLASRKPKAELFIEVSMAIVRDDVSPKPRARAPQ